MKKIFSYLLIVSLFSVNTLNAFAQADVEKAKLTLDKLSKQTKGYSTIEAVFSYNLKNTDAGIDETQEGKIYIKDDKYKLEIAGQQVMSDGKALYTFIKDVNEIQINNLPDPSENENFIDPAQIFTIYENGFKYKSEGIVKHDGKNLHQINLYPKEAKGKSYHTVKLFVDETKVQVDNIQIFGKDGNIYTYKVKNFSPNKSFSNDFFTFNESKFPGVDVIDLR